MSNTLYILFFVMLLGGCSIPPSMTEVESAELQKAISPQMQPSPQPDLILAKDYYVAKKALDKAIQDNDNSTIRLGLRGFSFQIRLAVIREIEVLGDTTFVPNLADALEANQGCLSGGSETDAFQRELDVAIVNLLRKLTKLEFKYFNNSLSNSCVDSSYLDKIKQISKESREWHKTHLVGATATSRR